MTDLPLIMMGVLCFLTIQSFMDADLPGVLGLGAITLAFAHMAWITRPTEKRARRD